MSPWSAASAPFSGVATQAAAGAPAVRPALGLLGVSAGTVAAVLLVPASEHYARGALIVPAAALIAGLLAGPVLSAARSPRAAFRTEHLLMFGLVYWLLLDALQSHATLWDVSRGTVQWTFFYIGLFAGGLWVGSALASLLARHRPVAPAAPDVGARFLFRVALLCAVLGFAQSLLTCEFSLVCVVESLYAPRFEVPWFSGPGIKGLNQALLYLKYFGYLILPLWVALYHAERRLTWRTLVLAPLALGFLLLLLRDGGRKEFGTVVGAALLTWLLLRPRLTLRHYALLLAAAAGLLMLLQLMVSWRDVGVTRGFTADQPAPKTYRGLVVDWDFDWMTHAVEVVPARAPHVGWDGVVYALGYPIPRSIWPGKPVMHGLDLPRYLGREYAPGFSWNCTSVCDLYLIGGGTVVALGGLFYGLLANFASRLLYRPVTVRSRLLYAVIVMALFLTLRALWEFTAQGMTVVALWGLLAAHALLLRLAARPAR